MKRGSSCWVKEARFATYPASPGLRWLALSQSPVSTRNGPKLHPQIRRLDVDRDWLLVEDGTYDRDVRLKRELFADVRSRCEVLATDDPTTLDAQRECWTDISEHLARRFPERFSLRRDDVTGEVSAVEVAGAECVALEDYSTPFEAAANVVQEDLLLMRASPSSSLPPSYSLAAAACCFSIVQVGERTRRQLSMEALHASVGGFERDLGAAVGRAMAGVTHETPIWRANWDVSFSSEMWPHTDLTDILDLEKRRRIFPDAHEDDLADDAVRLLREFGVDALHVKVEYQTLRRLHRNADCLLFTVHTYLEPFHALDPRAAACLATNIRNAAAHDIAKYKGLDDAGIVALIVDYLDKRACLGHHSE